MKPCGSSLTTDNVGQKFPSDGLWEGNQMGVEAKARGEYGCIRSQDSFNDWSTSLRLFSLNGRNHATLVLHCPKFEVPNTLPSAYLDCQYLFAPPA